MENIGLLSDVKRSFMPGDEWLYYKVYAGAKTCDAILSDVIKPLVMGFLKEEVIKKWFFIRYSDPDNHLRIRFLLKEQKYAGELMHRLQAALHFYLDEDQIWKVQIDTYHRELKRYGFENIVQAESIFSIESNLITDLIPFFQADDQLRWQITILMVDELLNSFSVSIEIKSKLLQELKEAYSLEFGMNKALKIHLDGKFRKERKALLGILASDNIPNEQVNECKKRIALGKMELTPIANEIIRKDHLNLLHVDFQTLLKSFIHMLCNRCFLTKPREQELIVYYLLSRYYQSEIAIYKKHLKMGMMVN